MGKWEGSEIEFDINMDSETEISISANKAGLTMLKNGIEKLINSKDVQDHFHIETENPPKDGMKYLVVWKK